MIMRVVSKSRSSRSASLIGRSTRAAPGLPVLAREQPGDPVVLAQEQDVEDRAADRRVAVLEPHREERVLLPLRRAGQEDVDQEVLVVQARELGLERSAGAPAAPRARRGTPGTPRRRSAGSSAGRRSSSAASGSSASDSP